MMMRVLMMNTARMMMIKTMIVKLHLSATFKETKYMQSHLEHAAGPCHHPGRNARTRILMRMITMMQLLLIMTMLMMLMMMMMMMMMMMLSMIIVMLLVMILLVMIIMMMMMMLMMLMLLPIMLIMLVMMMMMMMMMTMMMTMMMVTPLIQNINLQASTSGNFRQPLPTRGAPKSPTASSAPRARYYNRAPPTHATRNVAPSKRILRDSPDTPCPSHARCTPTSTRTVPR